MKARVCLALGLLISTRVFADVSTESEIRNFQLNTCLANKTSCIEAKSPLALGSFLRPVYSFESLDVAFASKTKNMKWKSVRGWFDLQNNQLVVIDANKKETVIYLDSMNIFEPET
jgi:hypothetical protein